MQIKIENNFLSFWTLYMLKYIILHIMVPYNMLTKNVFDACQNIVSTFIINIVHTKIYLNILKYINMNWYYITI